MHVSERRACAALGQHRSTQRKVPRGAWHQTPYEARTNAHSADKTNTLSKQTKTKQRRRRCAFVR